MENTNEFLDSSTNFDSSEINLNDSDTSNIDSNDLLMSNNIENTPDEHHTDHKFSILQFILNCLLHVTILFFFLYALFIILIGPIAQNAFKDEFHHIISDLINNQLPNESYDIDAMSDSELDNFLNSAYPGYNSQDPISKSLLRINIRQMYNVMKNNPYIIKNYVTEYSSPNYLIKDHNDVVLAYGYAIIIFLVTITLSLCILFKIYFPKDINLFKLFLENIITFIFIGIGEYWFFTTYAVKFIPAAPSLLTNSSIDTIKANFEKK
jgi:hypothetical protein